LNARSVCLVAANTLQRDASKHKDSTNALDAGSASKLVPHFDKAASKNVTSLLGKTAYLNCKVKNLGNKTVSYKTMRSLYLFPRECIY